MITNKKSSLQASTKMSHVVQNKWTLSFASTKLEAQYARELSRFTKKSAQIALLLAICTYVVHITLGSFLLPSLVSVRISFLHMLACLMLACLLAFTLHDKFYRYCQPLFAIATIAVVGEILLSMWYLPVDAMHYYAANVVIAMFWGHCFSLIRVKYYLPATFFACTMAILFFTLFKDISIIARHSFVVIIISTFLLINVANYLSEMRSRSLFLRERELSLQYRLHRKLSLHDQLTSLPNRALLMDRIEQAINSATRNHKRCAGYFLDLNNFKKINDTYGHALGDFVLIELGKRLAKVVRNADTVARISGDEFFVLAQGIESEEEAMLLGKKIASCINLPIHTPDNIIINDVSASIGVCMFPYQSATSLDIIKRADQAMYKSKNFDKTTIMLVSPPENPEVLAGAAEIIK